jgi:hypothetical protein
MGCERWVLKNVYATGRVGEVDVCGCREYRSPACVE